jgi:hypothetical protein
MTALATFGGAGLADRLDTWPIWSEPSGWGALALLGLAGAAWSLRRRPAPALPLLNLTLQPPAPQTLEGVLRFVGAAPLAWCARRGEWCLELEAGGPAGRFWRLDLRHVQWRQPVLTLAHAATFDDALTASRQLYVTRRPAAMNPVLREAACLLSCDFEFSLPGLQQRITALAEGGYALHDDGGCRALSPPAVDALLGEAGRVHCGGAG